MSEERGVGVASASCPQELSEVETVADDRYPAVFYSDNDPPRLGVARYTSTPDRICITMSLENKPGARWIEGAFPIAEAEQIALHILKKTREFRAATPRALADATLKKETP